MSENKAEAETGAPGMSSERKLENRIPVVVVVVGGGGLGRRPCHDLQKLEEQMLEGAGNEWPEMHRRWRKE